jgi:hypothetical protein
MKLTKTRTLRFTLAKYEYLESTATVEVDTEELEHTHQGAIEYANQLLDELQADDIKRAQDASSTPIDETAVHHWKGQ